MSTEEQEVILQGFICQVSGMNDGRLLECLVDMEGMWDEFTTGTRSFWPLHTLEDWTRYYNAIEEEVIKRGLR